MDQRSAHFVRDAGDWIESGRIDQRLYEPVHQAASQWHDLLVGVYDHVVLVGVDEPERQWDMQLAAAGSGRMDSSSQLVSQYRSAFHVDLVVCRPGGRYGWR